ncbi:MAG: MFS transporter [Epsilonproteobacteria bacterium]|nr:MFS transporter [Campylobacterota bacterium]OIO17369.1 MAG: MFS transporter [Helicobacteraceae bacterium CG1_02_36_14]PIP10874.1 MAG: MFS transporter [Sulfurimonas sp. CG23_combo_of_CG06-09_8_20_14_all_36_33]PIS26733.1 MAG: MFS transporter [Sulfurimonas sp. CG08_land_8_20_14_0_20_36_33]PIU35051.1 MAG: MFS transporter [Sulfurimonas sp. CG07_land_8_20_14_0_80_36_56]PIV03296.1 MAG: MFS transporter [Sulfurimonas sp. CG03_land_8_20_14_0_80_36_25]PIV36519.1 MAG: MFS transporter [Sulfurimonas sp.
MNEYYKLLMSEPILKRLSAIQLIAYFGAWFSNIAIYTLLLELNVSVEVIAFTAMLHFLAGVIQAPFSGSIIDTLRPKNLMLSLIAVEVFSTLFLVFVNDINDLWLLYTLIFFKMAAASFYFTTEMSLLPKILNGKKLQTANEIHSIIWSLSYTFGMALSGFVVYWLGVKTAFILDAFLFMVGFVLLYQLEIKVEFIKSSENLYEMMRDTFRYLKRFPHAVHLMLVHSFVGLTAFDALVALMVDKYYASVIATSLALGLVHASRAIGLVVGPILFAKYINKNKKIIYIFIFQGLAVWLWAMLMKDFYLSLLASVVVGLFTTTLWSYTYTLLQKNIEQKYYGRIVAYNDMLFLSSAAFTSYVIGLLASNGFSLEFITFLIGVGFMVGALYFAWILKSQKIKEIE